MFVFGATGTRRTAEQSPVLWLGWVQCGRNWATNNRARSLIDEACRQTCGQEMRYFTAWTPVLAPPWRYLLCAGSLAPERDPLQLRRVQLSVRPPVQKVCGPEHFESISANMPQSGLLLPMDRARRRDSVAALDRQKLHCLWLCPKTDEDHLPASIGKGLHQAIATGGASASKYYRSFLSCSWPRSR
jgi:hypothetical protein